MSRTIFVVLLGFAVFSSGCHYSGEFGFRHSHTPYVINESATVSGGGCGCSTSSMIVSQSPPIIQQGYPVMPTTGPSTVPPQKVMPISQYEPMPTIPVSQIKQ